MDSDYRAAVLNSIRELPHSYGAEAVRTLYAAAIENWDHPSQESDRAKACDGLFVWYWAAPNYKVTKQSFVQCPSIWKQEAFSVGRIPPNILADSELGEQLLNVCSSLFYERIFETRNINSAGMFKNCPKSWQKSTFYPEDGEYQKMIIVEPIVPTNAVRRCKNGWAAVEYDISADGSTKNIVIVDASDRMFRKPTIQAVEQWVYRPTRKNGEFVETVGMSYKAIFEVEC